MTNENLPSQGNYELQQELLRKLQREISDRLFISGAASRIIEAKPPEIGAKTDATGLAQLDKLFVPNIALKQVDGRHERVLRLAIVTYHEEYDRRTYGYINLGEIDEQDFLHVFPGIPEDDAWAVFNEATSLDQLRRPDGDLAPELPNLELNLLNVFNPNTAIQKLG